MLLSVKAKILINTIYNCHLSGSCLWDLFSKEAVQLESTWNLSMKLMMDLPRGTHRRLIEPLSEVTHIRTVLIKRFLNFLQQIKKSSKNASKFLLESIQHDTRSITGSNLRNILLKTDKAIIKDLVPNDVQHLKYHPIQVEEMWKVNMIREVIETKNNNLELVDFSEGELDEILEFLCVM